MKKLRPCRKGPGGTPCGNVRSDGVWDKLSCRRCWWNGQPSDPAGVLRRNANAPCRHRGPALSGPERQALYDAGQHWVDHKRAWALCTLPGFVREGQAMCLCAVTNRPRCGPTCDGYEAREKPHD